MSAMDTLAMRTTDLQTPVRNHYFYGKLLDVYHFELETNYTNAKRWLLNRLVGRPGVACGLDVKRGHEPDEIVVTPGLAIDKWGREIIVPTESRPQKIPSHLVPTPEGANRQVEQYKQETAEPVVQVLLCYHECESDPAPILAGDCSSVEICAAGTIRERYKIEFREGPADPISVECVFPDVVTGRRLNYDLLATWVTQGCPEFPEDPCIPLANIRVSRRDRHACDVVDIDITIRPIVLTNDVLYQIILSLLIETPRGRIR